MSKYDVVLEEVLELLRKRGMDDDDIVRMGMALAGGVIGTISEDRITLEENFEKFMKVFKEAATDVFLDPEEN